MYTSPSVRTYRLRFYFSETFCRHEIFRVDVDLRVRRNRGWVGVLHKKKCLQRRHLRLVRAISHCPALGRQLEGRGPVEVLVLLMTHIHKTTVLFELPPNTSCQKYSLRQDGKAFTSSAGYKRTILTDTDTHVERKTLLNTGAILRRATYLVHTNISLCRSNLLLCNDNTINNHLYIVYIIFYL